MILTDTGFSKRDYDRYLIEKLNKFYDVTVIDLSSYLNKKVFNINLKKQKIFEFNNFIKVENLDDFKKLLNKIEYSYAIDYISSKNKKTLKFMQFLKSTKIQLVYIQLGLVSQTIRSKKEKILRLLRLLTDPFAFIKKVFAILNTRIRKKIFQSIIYDFMFISGVEGEKDPIAKLAKKRIYTHSSDYENTLNNLSNNFNFKNYIVFIDQNLPFHPAQFYRGEKPQVTEKKYFPALARAFKYLEQTFEKDIIIATHPRANVTNYQNYFKGRKFLNSDTIDLVKYCDCVLAHTTTAISYAVIYQKPIIFLTSDEIIKSYDDYRVHSNARILGSEMLNIDHINLNSAKLKNYELQVNTKKYDLFMNNFIKHPNSENTNLTDQIIKNLN